MPDSGKRAEQLIRAVQAHADLVLDHAKDPTGSTPLFANGVDLARGTVARLDTDHVRKGAVLSNSASQQHWFRLLLVLGELTGEPVYGEAALKAYRYIMRHHTDDRGLIKWGGHAAYDLELQQIVHADDKPKAHELKMHYPAYDLMWQADPEGTKRYIEAMWNAHILDWANLDFNRHGPYDAPEGALWNHEYEGGDVFFWGKGLTFVNAGSDLYYAAAMLSKLSGEKAPLEWAKRLAYRYVETRQGDIGISGYQFSQSATSWCDGPAVRGDRAQYQLAPLIPEGHLVYEGTLFKPRPGVQRCQLALGEALGVDGDVFVRWSIEEMTAWGKHAYRRKDNRFIPMLTDGYSLEGLVLDRKGYYGPKGKVIEAIPADADFFWMYAYGYRLTGDEFLWRMARDIGRGIGLGDIGEPHAGGTAPAWNPNYANFDYRLLNGLMELYEATRNFAFQECAHRGAEAALAKSVNGWLGTWNGKLVVTNHPLPLTLLRLAALDRQEGTYPSRIVLFN